MRNSGCHFAFLIYCILVHRVQKNWSFSLVHLTLLIGQQEAHPACRKAGCWFVSGNDILLELCMSYSSSCHHHLHHP